MSKKYRDKDWLKDKYINKKMRQQDIAELCNTGQCTISKWVQEYDLERPKPKYRKEEWLREQYIEKELTTMEIAEKCDVQHTAIYEALKDFEIETRLHKARNKKYHNEKWLREKYVKEKYKQSEIADMCDTNICQISKYINKFNIESRDWENKYQDKQYRNEDWLRGQYVEEGKNSIEISDMCNVDNCTIQYWLDKFDVDTSLEKSQEEFEEDVDSLKGEEYSVLGEYEHTKAPILVRHNECGYEWKVIPNNFLRGSRCPKCYSSRFHSNGETEIADLLDKYDIDYKREYWFDDCRNKYPLPFDFALFDNSELLCLVEYHGIQHYEPVPNWGGERGFAKRQMKDQIKRNYCENENIPLLEISHEQKGKLESILEQDVAISYANTNPQ